MYYVVDKCYIDVVLPYIKPNKDVDVDNKFDIDVV
jgi:hypothetical protein